MARHVDLGYDGDVPAPRVRDELSVLTLRVVAARPTADGGLPAVRRQARPSLDLKAPSLVIREVQVEAVQLVPRHRVDEMLDVGHAEEVPRDVEHCSAPAKAGRVANRAGGSSPRPRPDGSTLDRGR
jgi:hypothetical protein